MMKDMGIVQGSGEQAKPIVVGKDTVYTHTDIVKLDTDSDGNPVDNLYEYRETQYDLHEYLQLSIEQTRADIDYISIMTGVEI
jgi:hypothetical protein